MNQIYFQVPGQPQGKARARTVRMKNGFSHSYTPDKTVNYESAVVTAFLAVAGAEHVPLDRELTMIIDAFYQIPTSKSKKQQALMRDHTIRPTTKPDADNLAKIVCDALNKVAFTDDTRIVDLRIRKWYTGNIPRIEVVIKDASHIEAMG